MGFNAFGEFDPNISNLAGSLRTRAEAELQNSYTNSVGSSSSAFSSTIGDAISAGLVTSSSGSKYSLDNYSYPSDLFSNKREYGGNYAVFYINVPTESKLITEENVETVDIGNSETFRADITRQGYDSAAAMAGSTLVGGLGGTILGALGSGGGGAAAGGLLGGGLGFLAGGVVSAAAGGKMSRQVKRLKTAIALHVPNQLSTTYSTQWDTEDTALFQIGAKLGEAGVKAVSDLDPKKLQETLKEAGGVLGSAAVGLGLNAPGGGALSAMSGLAFNPKKEQVFKGVDFRTFTFDYQFSPRDDIELQNVKNIIKMFKLHMHPEFKDEANFLYLYPSEFDIFYYNGVDENKALFKHTSCVLTTLNVNYTPNAAFNTFGGKDGINGSPTQISIQLTFKELALLTKKQIQDGF